MRDFSQRPFTYSYSQPDEYHYCLESVEMPLRAAEILGEATDLSSKKAVDICAGCGIIGLEFQFHAPSIGAMDFVEIQEGYRPHFEKNLATAGRSCETFRFLNMSYAALLEERWRNHYDIVLCNPPFFNAGHGALSPNGFRNRCRFFLDSSFDVLVQAVTHILAPDGVAFLQIRPLHEHKMDMVKRVIAASEERLVCVSRTAVRRSVLLCLRKLPG